MDFQQLAEATSISSIRRVLQTISEDDDFSHLDTSVTSHHSTGNDSILEFTKSKSLAGDSLTFNENAPMLSQDAEAELLKLAVNFLLYAAIVLVITMVAKIYFPESLERSAPMSQPGTRTVHYRRMDPQSSKESDSCCTSDEEEEGSGSGNDGSLGDSLEYEEEIGHTPKGNFLDFEFEQENTSRTEVMKRLVFCVVMLNVTFVTWGLLQERMLTRRYPRNSGEYFTYSYALVFTNRFWTLVMSGMLIFYLKPKRSSSTVIYEYSFPSISNMLSSWCQYESLRYVSFPAATLFKSFKLAPVMAMGKFLGNKQYPQYDYYVALAIGIGITLFISSTEDFRFGYNIYETTVDDEKDSTVWTGIMLLIIFLFFDSFTSQWQSRMFQRHRDLSMVELMFATSAFSSLLSFISLIHSQELWPALDFIHRHSEIHFHFLLFSICSTIGQLLIFYTIKNFGAVVFTIIMTTRVLLSIALSCHIFDHKVTQIGILGLVLVMSAIMYRIKRKAESSQLVKWRGMEDARAPQLVQEWHEHVDM